MDKISYKGNLINTLEDLNSFSILKNNHIQYDALLNPSTPNIGNDIQDKITFFAKWEYILHQRKHSMTVDYTFEEMIKTQDYLEALEFMETLKYLPNYTNARKLLHKYLHSGYNFSSCNLLTSLREDSFFTIKTLMPHDPLPYDDKKLIQITDEKNQPSLSSSLRKHLTSYLSMLKNSNNRIMRCGISSSDSASNSNAKERFYLPLGEIPEFLLLFTYYDGRNFSHSCSQKNPQKIPSGRKGSSRYSYGLVLDQLQKLPCENISLTPYMISTLIRCDIMFFHLKLNMLSQYYDRYTSPDMMDLIIQSHSLTYSEILNLRKFIIDEVFKDRQFLIIGLKSSYLDFMLPFDISFRYNLLLAPPHKYQTLSELKEAFVQVKKDTMLFLSVKIDPQNEQIFSIKPDRPFVIAEYEKLICAYLNDDKFFKNYFLSENIFIKDFCSSQKESHQHVIDFDTIKAALPISFNQA